MHRGALYGIYSCRRYDTQIPGGLSTPLYLRRGEEKKYYVHPRARYTNDGSTPSSQPNKQDKGPKSELSSSKSELSSSSKSKPAVVAAEGRGKGETRNDEQNSKVANSRKVSANTTPHRDRSSRSHPYKHNRPYSHDYRPHNYRQDNKAHPYKENRAHSSRELSKSNEKTTNITEVVDPISSSSLDKK